MTIMLLTVTTGFTVSKDYCSMETLSIISIDYVGDCCFKETVADCCFEENVYVHMITDLIVSGNANLVSVKETEVISPYLHNQISNEKYKILDVCLLNITKSSLPNVFVNIQAWLQSFLN